MVFGPAWLDRVHYDIVGKGADPNATNPEVWEMMRSFLAEHFQMKYHIETRELPVYALVVAKGGPKLKRPEDGPCGPKIKAGENCGDIGPIAPFAVGITNMPVGALIGGLGRAIQDRPIIDKTGLTGKYDGRVLWMPDNMKPEDVAQLPADLRPPEDVSLFTAIEQQLGLNRGAEGASAGCGGGQHSAAARGGEADCAAAYSGSHREVTAMRMRMTAFVLSAIVAQAAGAEFDVASIRPNVSGTDQVQFPRPGGDRFTATNVSLRMLVMRAYKVKDYALSGGPGWMNSDRFDITATAAGGIPDEAAFKVMLQALLASRFGLRVHRETRQLPVYALVALKNGVTPSNPVGECINPNAPQPATPLIPCGGFFLNNGQFEGRRITMTQLVNALSDLLGRPVLDNTGYTGAFDMNMEFTFEGIAQFNDGGFAAPSLPAEAGNPDAKPTIFTAIRRQLGMKLESQKGTAEILVVDHAEKPSGN